MGRYVKIYLNDIHEKGLGVWQDRREQETGNRPAVNALMNEALRNELYAEEIFFDKKIGSASVMQVVEQGAPE